MVPKLSGKKTNACFGKDHDGTNFFWTMDNVGNNLNWQGLPI
jgi:hypothetical protein